MRSSSRSCSSAARLPPAPATIAAIIRSRLSLMACSSGAAPLLAFHENGSGSPNAWRSASRRSRSRSTSAVSR